MMLSNLLRVHHMLLQLPVINCRAAEKVSFVLNFLMCLFYQYVLVGSPHPFLRLLVPFSSKINTPIALLSQPNPRRCFLFPWCLPSGFGHLSFSLLEHYHSTSSMREDFISNCNFHGIVIFRVIPSSSKGGYEPYRYCLLGMSKPKVLVCYVPKLACYNTVLMCETCSMIAFLFQSEANTSS